MDHKCIEDFKKQIKLFFAECDRMNAPAWDDNNLTRSFRASYLLFHYYWLELQLLAMMAQILTSSEEHSCPNSHRKQTRCQKSNTQTN